MEDYILRAGDPTGAADEARDAVAVLHDATC